MKVALITDFSENARIDGFVKEEVAKRLEGVDGLPETVYAHLHATAVPGIVGVYFYQRTPRVWVDFFLRTKDLTILTREEFSRICDEAGY